MSIDPHHVVCAAGLYTSSHKAPAAGAGKFRWRLTMSIDRAVLAFAGAMILLSLALSQTHHPAWLWLTAFVGANLLQSAFTGFCPLARILKAFGVRPGEAFH
jgi:hypothetical protein